MSGGTVQSSGLMHNTVKAELWQQSLLFKLGQPIKWATCWALCFWSETVFLFFWSSLCLAFFQCLSSFHMRDVFIQFRCLQVQFVFLRVFVILDFNSSFFFLLLSDESNFDGAKENHPPLMTPTPKKRRCLGPLEACEVQIREARAPILHFNLKEQEVHSLWPCTYLTAVNNLTKRFYLSALGIHWIHRLFLTSLWMVDVSATHVFSTTSTRKLTKASLILSAGYWGLFMNAFSTWSLYSYFVKSNTRFYIFYVTRHTKRAVWWMYYCLWLWEKCCCSSVAVQQNESSGIFFNMSTGGWWINDRGFDTRITAIQRDCGQGPSWPYFPSPTWWVSGLYPY